jgi:hypothetical protein
MTCPSKRTANEFESGSPGDFPATYPGRFFGVGDHV